MNGRVSIAALLLFSYPSIGLAFKCERTGDTVDTGPSLWWSSRTIPWWVDRAIAGKDAVRASFATWDGIRCSDIELPFMGERASAVSAFDGENVVVRVASGWMQEPAAVAYTMKFFDVFTGQLFDADILLNDEGFDFVDAATSCDASAMQMDLENTVTHEIGHLLGLDHSPNTPRYRATTMHASAPFCEIEKRSLEADDIDGICAIYPAGAPVAPCYGEGTKGFSVAANVDGFEGCEAIAPQSIAELLCLLGGLFSIAYSRRIRARRVR